MSTLYPKYYILYLSGQFFENSARLWDNYEKYYSIKSEQVQLAVSRIKQIYELLLTNFESVLKEIVWKTQ